ncbi:MAG: S-methyl-5'-thioinosine phosphorylase [Gammaproteobacteria bacterium]|nr:S-methyl-5'-thioinosine phosphorylase [Rhodocyclaceae bacterium]MBU3908988.1 S-methyl-5'-thioinosine phosphorylase [Gammaproteobacteria bacterium]MBU3988672.1 S-methyl-5'-thioinosine phosphorylase [Gammaproteobacteria bacterium]MBU4005859.1 S-methyl-5'-thioinosine phosphorylase [Gammaproteobacteria bacterium]MBU4021623.1 S-methyl-5'-thioinosine phosphorylase [Gammaproteobacteria bacterium]
MLAIIGGSGLTQLSCLEIERREVVRTPYGEPSGTLAYGSIGRQQVVFLARHGHGHTIPPHRVNYRANIWALVKAAGADGIVSVASVGGMRDDLKPGALVVPHQIIDYTWGRLATFFDGGDAAVVHVDFTEPYDRSLRERLLRAGEMALLPLAGTAVYAATQGPRLESAAEIERLVRDGADIVGMTGMPEAVLARELKTPYAAVCVVANWAAGRGDSTSAIRFDQIEAVLHDSMGKVRRVIEQLCAATV